MKNQKKYRFDDFTIKKYEDLVKIAKNNNFVFSLFSDPLMNSKQILWRHDVEFSPFIAFKMAEIELKECVKSTYFFQIHSEYYNVFERDISDIVHKIKSMGHDIGLHFDSHYFKINNLYDLEKYINIDKRYFESIFDIKINVFSFHNTDSFILSCENRRYSGLINVYSKYFKDKYRYCSDSTGYWRDERLYDVLNDQGIKRLQVLTHDAMWSQEILSPKIRVYNSIDDNCKRVKQLYDSTLLKFSANNIE
jgi:hypothetical protein